MNLELKQKARESSRKGWQQAVGLQDQVETQVYANLFDQSGTHVGVTFKSAVPGPVHDVLAAGGEGWASNPYAQALKRGRSSSNLDPAVQGVPRSSSNLDPSVQSVPLLQESSPLQESPQFRLSPEEPGESSGQHPVPTPTSQPIPSSQDFVDAVQREVDREVKRMKSIDPRPEPGELREIRAEVLKTALSIHRKSVEIKSACGRVSELCDQLLQGSE